MERYLGVRVCFLEIVLEKGLITGFVPEFHSTSELPLFQCGW